MSLYGVAEFNTIVTMLGCLCATVQAGTGMYAAIKKDKISILKTNDILFRSHRAFGGFATTLYFLGLFAGLTGFYGAITQNNPPLELESSSFNVHTWPSFVVMVVIIWKTYISYFKKRSIYRKGKWLGIATFIAWAFTWITSAISYYIRTVPPNLQHPPPAFLFPYELLWLQIIWPFLIAGLILIPILRKAAVIENKKEERARMKDKQSDPGN